MNDNVIEQHLKPEELARVKIDEQLADAGWHIADRNHFTYEHNAIGLVEALLDGNKEADYLLFVDGKVIGVLEAKRSDVDLEQAAGEQAADYVYDIPDEYPQWKRHPQVVILANGEKILLKSFSFVGLSVTFDLLYQSLLLFLMITFNKALSACSLRAVLYHIFRRVSIGNLHKHFSQNPGIFVHFAD